MAEATMCVRLKAVAPRAGHVLRTFSYAGLVFGAGKGWARVSERVAEYLRTVRQRERDPHSPLAFDVCSEDEARRIDARELEQNMDVMPVDRAPILVGRDEPGGQNALVPPGAETRERAKVQDDGAGPAGGEPSRDRPSARAKH